jgi:hypothetical protein
MIELAIRITNFGAAANVGGDPEVTTHIVSLEAPELEELLKHQQWETKTISIAKRNKKEDVKSGIKNNTVRILSENEYNIVSWKSVVQIEILNLITEQNFRRDLTDISRIGYICGSNLVVFTWKVEDENGK